MIPLRDANPTRRTPVVTLGLIGACFLGWAYELFLLGSEGSGALDAFLTDWGVVPAELMSAWAAGDWVSVETATLVTSQFLHAGWLHILGNMLFLWIFGNNIEDRLGLVLFLVFYLAAGVVAGLTQVMIDPTSTIPTIGASGAIAGTLGAYLVLYPRARITSLVFLGFFYQLIDVPAVIVLLFWIALQLIDGFASLGVTDADGGVAFFAHIGGFAFGAAVAFLLVRTGRRPARATGTFGAPVVTAAEPGESAEPTEPGGPTDPTRVG
jgi:membrane associated rhomboid family serine protease